MFLIHIMLFTIILYLGYVDIVLDGVGGLFVLFNNMGNCTSFSERKICEKETCNTRFHSIAIGDVNGDGLLDIAAVGGFSSGEAVYIQNRSGGEMFTALPRRTYLKFIWYGEIALADINGDDRIDIIMITAQQGFLFLNRGDDLVFDNDAISLPKLKVNDIAVGDINGDGKIDIVCGTLDDNDYLLLNMGDNQFDKIELPGLVASTRSLALGDVNGDGKIDILIGRSTNKSAIRGRNTNAVLLNIDGTSFKFNELPQTNSTRTSNVAFINVHGDEKLDIICAYENLYEDEITPTEIFLNEENLEYSFSPIDLSINYDSEGSLTTAVAIVDLRGAGKLNMVIANRNIPNQIISIDGDYENLPGGNKATTCVTTADMNKDGKIDIIIGNFDQPNQLLLQNSGGGTFDVQELPGKNTKTEALAVADFDGDNNLDIVFGNKYGFNHILYRHTNGTFWMKSLPESDSMKTVALAVGDIDGNGSVDIVVANFNQPNHILVNDGKGEFHIAELPGGSSVTTSLAVGDFNGDHHLDIVVGNSFGPNYLLLNDRSGNFIAHEELPGSYLPTFSLAVLDLEGNGLHDIMVGVEGRENHILHNRGNTTFVMKTLPGELRRTRAVAAADIDGEGRLDLIIGNFGESNQILHANACLGGGAYLHGASWCFSCPDFMGRATVFGQQVQICLECLPDHMQLFGEEEQCNPYPCFFQERLLGENECVRCSSGTFYSSVERKDDNSSTWEEKRCQECPVGYYADEADILPIDECFPCRPGTFQNSTGEKKCLECASGSFQAESGRDQCEPCDTGGYCDKSDTIGGGFISCPAGTYNDKVGQASKESCVPCPIGTVGRKDGAKTVNSCQKCLPGTFTNKTGQTECITCPIGRYQSKAGQSSCGKCEPGSYADKVGLPSCIPCHYRLSSERGSSICPFCKKDFYLRDVTVDGNDLFSKPDYYCDPCPPHSKCAENTTVDTIGVEEGYWRDSSKTTKIYECEFKKACKVSADYHILPNSEETLQNSLCTKNHKGPLCQVCSISHQYFDFGKGYCDECPSFFRLNKFTATMLVIFLLTVGLAFASQYFHSMGQFVRELFQKLSDFTERLGLQAKLKMLIAFYQVVNSLQPIYGVRFDKKLRSWFNTFKIFDFEIFGVFGFPSQCFSMAMRLIIASLWPYAVVIILLIGFKSYSCTRRKSGTKQEETKFWPGFLYCTIALFHTVLPTVSSSIFDAIKCRSFVTDDLANKAENSYLMADLNIACDESNSEYEKLLKMFWLFFFLWPVMVPIVFLVLLLTVRRSVRLKRVSLLTNACGFLWRDYSESMMFWEIIDVLRRVFLLGIIMFIDIKEGSNRVFRLVIAIVVSSFYVIILGLAQPYKRMIDRNLSFTCNFMLILLFVLGIPIHQCSDETDDICLKTIGRSFNSYRASLVALIVTISMLVIFAAFIVVVMVNYFSASVVRLVSSGEKPNLEMPADCQKHAFVSHIWSTGQDKTHKFVWMMQKYLPEINFWLDVNDLTDMDQLEQSVSEAAVFVIFYSGGYFRSRNCRREINAAVSLNKPTYIVYEGDDKSIADMKNECRNNCTTEIFDHIFEHEPILWLSTKYFSIESVKKVSLCILKELPYYQKNKSQLTSGVTVKDELGPVEFYCPLEIMVCHANVGCTELASQIVEKVTGDVSLVDASIALRSTAESIEPFEPQDIPSTGSTKKRVFLLCLNEHTFLDEGGEVQDLVKTASEMRIPIVLVHEQTKDKGAHPFYLFFDQTPQELIDPPFEIYRSIATPFYFIDEYREISLRLIMMEMGATARQAKNYFLTLSQKLLRVSQRN